MRRTNIFSPEFDHSSERDGYRWRGARVGRAIGGKQIGGCAVRARRRRADAIRSTSITGWRSGSSWSQGRRCCATPTASGCSARATSSASRRARRAPPGARPGVGADRLGVSLARVVEYPDSGKVGVAPAGRSSASPTRPTTGRASERVVNLFDAPRAPDEGDPPGYEVPFARIGPLVGGAALGHDGVRARRGHSICPYHYEYPCEEWLIVLEGTPTLRDPEGEHELDPGDVVCFPPGPDGAHKVTNRSRRARPRRDALDEAEARRHRLSRQRQGRRLVRRRRRRGSSRDPPPSTTGTASSEPPSKPHLSLFGLTPGAMSWGLSPHVARRPCPGDCPRAVAFVAPVPGTVPGTGQKRR